MSWNMPQPPVIAKKRQARPAEEEPVAAPVQPEPVAATAATANELFRPKPIESFKEGGISSSLAESLVLKYLLTHGASAGRQITEGLALPLKDLKTLLNDLKDEQMVYYKDSGHLDFTYALSDLGRDRAKKYFEERSYLGAAPVPLKDYM